MLPLEKTLRTSLERTVKEARDIAEAAASSALEQLGVGEQAPFPYLSESEKSLRRRLRVHGRNLGDVRFVEGTQEIDRLIEEVAYEHWHRMLFARFLAENDLLMYSDGSVYVTLEECEDLAADEGAKNGWELASRYAARMLPQIFRPNSPVFELDLPPEYQQKLERLIQDLHKDVFIASDSLGWVYQFWQAKKKDEVNRSEVKIGARELPSQTQLFTEPYMVSFLLDNSLGAWWGSQRLSDVDLTTAQNEEELRQMVSLPGVPLDYLRFVKKEDGRWTPAGGTFDAWPTHLSELKTLDPCCGSGHFLVAAFLMLVPMRMELEELSAQEAIDAVITDNLNGLEIDARCVELAAFALALAAWRYPNAGGYRELPEMNLACSGLSISAKKEDWLKLAKGDASLESALETLYYRFMNAPVLGSLIDPTADLGRGTLYDRPWAEVAPLLNRALKGDVDDEKTEMGVVAQGLAKAAGLMANKYHWVITNVPYLARGKQSDLLKDFCEACHPLAKNDLATVFLDRCLGYCLEGGNTSIVLPQNWLFLVSYKKFRETILTKDSWNIVAWLGEKGFDSPAAAGAFTALISIDRILAEVDDCISGLDVAKSRQPSDKSKLLRILDIRRFEQQKQLKNPGSRISLEELSSVNSLENYAIIREGLHTGDYPRFGRKYWELLKITDGWSYQQGGVTTHSPFSGMEHTLFWEKGDGTLINFVRERLGTDNVSAWIKGNGVWTKKGFTIGAMRDLKSSYYCGSLFTHGIYAIVPRDIKYYAAIKAFCSSSDFSSEVRKLDHKVCVARDSIAKVPFDLDRWTQVAAKQYPHGLPDPYSDDPTQWIFHGHPCGSVVWDDETKMLAEGQLRTDATVLQVAVARLLGYRWPAEMDQQMDLADLQRELVQRCNILQPFSDDDGIVCIPPVRGEASAADRVYRLLAAAYGDEWSNSILKILLKEVGYDGKGLEVWLREKFFAEHCKLFHNRPFIWHIWDGLPDGFAALVNYHTLDYKNLQTLTYTYLGDWISRQKQDITHGVDGAEEKLAAAEGLKMKLELILKGESPYDIFIRWKPLDKQPIGWNPDLNDGVRLNIRPFMSVPDVKKKGAGILREKPNIKWGKDRGKDVDSAPWYDLGLQYGGKEGDRINDHHLSIAEKKKAREESI